MKFLILLFLCGILNANDTLRFTPLPMESLTKTLEIFAPFIAFLEQKSGKKVEIVYKTKNEDIIDGIKKGQIDIAHFGPLPYAQAIQTFSGVIPIIQFLEKDGSHSYTCTLFKRKDVELSLSNATQRDFALTHKFSTCGYIFVEDGMKKHANSLDNNHFQYMGSHYSVITSVVNGDFDAGGVKTSIFEQFAYLDIEPLFVGEPNPLLMLVANAATLSRQEIEKIKTWILHAKESEKKTWDPKINQPVEADLKALNNYAKKISTIPIKDEL